MSDQFEPYYLRARRLRGEEPDVYLYDNIPERLRGQAWRIFENIDSEFSPVIRKSITDITIGLMRDELGTLKLTDKPLPSYAYELYYFMMHSDADNFLTSAEFYVKLAEYFGRKHGKASFVEERIANLNRRFRENGVGYRYENGIIIRADSELLHIEAIKPAIRLLTDSAFAAAEEEYMAAHEKFRHGDNKGCLVECLKALETTIKTICQLREWEYDRHDPAKKLIAAIFKNGLIPPYLESHFTGLRSTLESGVPTIRNKEGGHGQGPDPTTVPDWLVTYALHLSASAIVMLIKAHKAAA